MAKKKEPRKTDIRDNNNKNTENRRKKSSISEDDLRMPNASGDVKGPFAAKGENEKDTNAKKKKPSKITQPAKGRSSDRKENASANKSSEPTSGVPQSNTDKIKSLPKPNPALPEHETSETGSEKKGGVKGKGDKKKKSGNSSQKKTGTPPKSATGTRKKTSKGTEEKISPGPEVRGSGKKQKAQKENKEEKETSIKEDLTNLAMSTAKEITDKFLPDEETRDQIARTAKEIFPDEEEIKKTVKDLKNKFSPEVEQVNKIVDKVIPKDKIRDKSDKIVKAAKDIKTKNQEKAAEKKFNEISLISEFDIHLFKEGKHFHLYKKLGSHVMDLKGTTGVYFALWAPNAQSVSVIGDFNEWYKMANPMNSRPDGSGIWEVFIPEAKQGSIYKYFIKSTSGYEAEKGDPYAFMWEVPPNTASVVWDLKSTWNDEVWLEKRKMNAGKAKPVSVYEIHLGSWKRVPEDGNRSLSYRELAEQLPDYLNELGFTHVEFMPVMEHPFFGSWGYQVTGYFAPSSRFGTPQDFMFLIDSLHQAGIGVILDWVPSHFPSDLHGLHYFDGTFLYEHADPQKGFHPDWQSYIFNYGRNEVRSFLISNALFWLDIFHADGLRVDAVASMLYLDYSRKHGEWQPNEQGGNENLEAISFLKEFNEVVYSEFPDTMTIAEESTAWPLVSKPTYMGGLGFGMKWMMGWMHDTLEYFQKDPIHRKHHQNTITFSTNYAFTENFMLPLSHDEVVYGKQSLWNKMPGDDWNKFANLRAMYSYMFAHPGTKLLFMGAEFAQTTEWGHDTSLDWHRTREEPHQGIQRTLAALNKLYKEETALYEKSFDPEGFEWVDFNDSESSVMSFLRKGNDPGDSILIICNLTPVPRENYRIGVPEDGTWRELFNSDDQNFGGSNVRNPQVVKSETLPVHGKNYSLALTLPPMGVIYLKKDRSSGSTGSNRKESKRNKI